MSTGATAIRHNARDILDRMETELSTSARLGGERWPGIFSRAQAAIQLRPSNVVLTGCGDSFYAGLAVRDALEQLSGVPVVAAPAMEIARFPTRLLGRDSVLIGISVSGKVERTIEAVREHRKRGGTTIAISAFSDSDLAQAAETSVATEMRGTPGPVPGTANYLGSLLALYGLGFALASRRGGELKPDSVVTEALSALETTLVEARRWANVIAPELRVPFFALASGPDFGSACFGVAKFIEAASTLGVAQDLEEWAHEQYFVTGPGRTVFVFAADPRAVDRAQRVARSARTVGADVIVIGQSMDSPNGDRLMGPLPNVPSLTMPLISWAPLACAALSYARASGRSPFGLDQPGRMQTADDDIYLPNPRRR